MWRWQAQASQFPPLALTFTFTLVLTLMSLITSTPAQLDEWQGPEGKGERGRCQHLPDVECTPGFSVRFAGQQLTCELNLDPDLAGSVPEMMLGVVEDEEEANRVLSPTDDAEQEELLVVMVDPDAPSADLCPQTYYLHWIALVDLKEGVVTPKKDIVEYNGPTPPPGTGVHRYQLLLYSLDGKEAESPYLVAPKRPGFDLQSFENSVGLGEPVASFQFRAEN